MSSALRVEQPRSWWSLSSKSSKQDLHKQYANDKSSASVSKSSSGRNFPSFSSVIGRKSKKHPTLAIQEPPSPLKSSSASHTRREIPPQFHLDPQSRPRLKSPQPLSPADSIELVTPVDSFREGRQSLLTLDNDPFAVQGITVHAPASPSHLSTHSSNSFLDVSSRKDKSTLYVRASYSSSSSNSHSPRESHSHNLLKVHATSPDHRMLSSSKSMNNLRRKPSYVDPEPPLPSGYHSQPNSRPPTRSRGMTESGSIRPPFLQEAYAATRQRRPSSPGNSLPPSRGTTSPLIPSLVPGSQPSSRPSSRPPSGGRTTPNQLGSAAPINKTQTITRQASIQRLQPPMAPPTHDLPPPPSKVTEEPSLEDELDVPVACNSSMSLSSSSISFVSSVSSSRELVGYLDPSRRQDTDLENWSFVTSLRPEAEADTNSILSATKLSSEISSPSRALKKTPSHYSLSKRPSPTQPVAPVSAEPPLDAPKVLRKQRSHHRLGIPPISLGFKHGHTVSASTPSSPQLSEPQAPPMLDPRRGSGTSHASVPVIPVRKRVFSGSSLRRPSTSSGAPTPANEDDARSLFSLRSDHEFFTNASPFKPWPTNMSTLGSFWEDHPPSPARSDYMPQPIMSPEDLAKVEAELDDISILSALPPPSTPLQSVRQRSTSASTVLSDRDSEIIPSSVFSQPLSEVMRSPQMSVRSIKSTVPSLSEMGGQSGTGVGRTTSLVAKSTTAPQLSRRPATASGSTTLGPVAPMSTIHEPEALKNSQSAPIGTSSPAISDSSSSTPISPLSLRKAQRKGSGASGSNPPPQLRSLPPPPRPRAKAEVVTVIDSRLSPSVEIRPAEAGNGSGKRNSIGVDFGHGQRYGHIVTPSIQSNTYHLPSQPVVIPPASYTPPVPPRASSRPPPPSYRRPRPSVTGVQKPPPNSMPNMNGGQRVSRRISLQRKPSFLDIDDDDDMGADRDLDFHAIMRMSSASSGAVSFSRSDHTSTSVAESFLEFGRESFDTLRSAELGPERF
ncbi:hypothetical protein D9756_006003 [Leucocoprinus leucothites]|uniref:Uncharacterized protein n=1 Tax=Leucocoprinus leucothites TaxID=201217 RepID=A0A8H5D4T8_9AGAR|nr:hypothetical protein D9756_006003 [Leucoagaricus leucothites]